MALIAAHLNAGHSDGDSIAIGIYSPTSHTPFPHFPLISLTVSVDVKHHVYLLLRTLPVGHLWYTPAVTASRLIPNQMIF